MRVILEQEVPALGSPGEVVDVARGYAHNYLLPRGLAVKATPGNIRQLDQKKAAWGRKEAALRQEAGELANTFAGKEITIESRAGASGKLFGSVTSKDVAGALKEQIGIDVDRRKIELPGAIKEAGSYDAKVRLHPDVEPTVKVTVVALTEGESPETE